MKNQFLLPMLCLLSLLITGCSQIELSSHMYKKFNRPPSEQQSASKGNFKVGKPYKIMGETYYPTETYDYVETGVASWYGPGFHGKKTASGERYDQYELTAAHRTLQMPSLVRVTNLANGKSAVLRVNDRGPFAHGRIIDVSKRAAELLDMTRTGTAKVKVEMLENESRALAHHARKGKSTNGTEIAYNKSGQLPSEFYVPPTGPVPSDIPSSESDLADVARESNITGHYKDGHFYPDAVVKQASVSTSQIYVQAGAFGDVNNARRLAEKLGQFSNASVEPSNYGDRILYKVRLGPLNNVQQADKILSKVLANGQSDAIIVVQ